MSDFLFLDQELILQGGLKLLQKLSGLLFWPTLYIATPVVGGATFFKMSKAPSFQIGSG